MGTEYVPESAKVAFAYPLAVIAWSLAAAWWASLIQDDELLRALAGIPLSASISLAPVTAQTVGA